MIKDVNYQTDKILFNQQFSELPDYNTRNIIHVITREKTDPLLSIFYWEDHRVGKDRKFPEIYDL